MFVNSVSTILQRQIKMEREGCNGTYASRRIRRQTPVREHARASSRQIEKQARGQLFLRAARRGHAAALRFSSGNRRRAEILGRAEGADARPVGETFRGARGRSSRRVRRF